MSILNRLERRYGRFAIPHLVLYIIFFKALVFILGHVNPAFLPVLAIDPQRVFSGEVWRLVTFLFIPDTLSLIWIALELYILYLMGTAVERTWGTFQFNVFYLIGALGTMIGALFLGGVGTSLFLHFSVFCAFATLFPKVEFRVFFILPVEVRWLALISLGVFIFMAIGSGPAAVIALIIALSNYIIFFGPTLRNYLRHRKDVGQRRATFKANSLPEEQTLHHCHRCGKTERDDQYLEFRVSAEDSEEYCLPCLKEIREGTTAETP